MNIAGSGVVVTGAGHGIGRAIAHRLAAEGGRVVVNDLDADAAHAVAAEINGDAVPGDAVTEEGVAELLEQARAHLGRIDIFCANAGTAAGEGPDTDEETWQHSWEVNTLAHVRASRALLPEWLDRGEGRFVVTASAAGLLTALGSAPYSVSKHAAVAYAEWMSATYGHRGVTVHCICPQGVRTQMLEGSGPMGDVLLRPTAIEPWQVADAVWEGITEGRFLILPHPEVHDYYQARAADTDRWLRGMRTLQQRIDGSAE
ncbi:SDR family oxidoreductase [Lipingzhangella sp. LS1_29]|uniref:SDR family oxidoreductase n=1 Tax=Lipingzhangella rawalii TaxID=2055835 RepID=A0ABU2H9K6_9ACTN|nr:SDR family oxidoreductase [Lipingzhangella rawalii]MDS1271530.1 SDR family oxidoreductase [Lipingzhangella rawalii]